MPLDKEGNPFELRSFGPEDFSALSDMYDFFKPKAGFQGMPPRDRTVADRWIRSLIQSGENFLALRGKKVIGHVVILPDFEREDAEFLIFVNQLNRGKGIGKELTRKALQRARDLGVKIVWLTVDAYNFRAIKLYRRFGFKFCEDYGSASERMMSLSLGEAQ
jgi:RimJ/RimL family protein N-acetyltransferase